MWQLTLVKWVLVNTIGSLFYLWVRINFSEAYRKKGIGDILALNRVLGALILKFKIVA